jgi:NAD(P)-dependent dehydrogenase (short-subunit alcohol dehydrogenase family)
MTRTIQPRRLDGSVAIVTGASRGIGRGCALELGAAGATVYVIGRTMTDGESEGPGSLEATVQEIRQLGGRGIVALATDPDVMARSGTAVTTRSLADDYGFVDIDGSLPPQQPWQPPPGPPVPRNKRA